MLTPLATALVALTAGFLLGRLTAPRAPRWAATLCGRLVYWTAPAADGRTLFVPVPATSTARRLAADLNARGLTPAMLDLAAGPIGGRQ